MSNELPLLIWSGGQPVDLAKVKAAKVQLEDEDFSPWPLPLPMVRPYNCGHDGAGVDLDARVLAIGTTPPFICNYFLVGEDAGLEEFTRAMEWVLRLRAEDERANTVLDTVSRIFGPGTREVSEEEQLANQKLREYQRNLR